MTAENV